MKLFLAFAFFIAICTTAASQEYSDSRPLYFNADTTLNVTLRLMNDSSFTGKVLRIYDSSIVMSLQNNLGNVFFRKIEVSQIRTIKIKEHAVLQGATGGGIITGAVGFAGGYVTTKGDNTQDDYYANARTRGWEWALISAVPGAIVGGIIGGIFIKRNYKIDGDERKFRMMQKKLFE